MALKNTKDHWAFLEEIEAPMWVDLTLETKPSYQDIDDGWFCNSHVFHQCSSRQLKAAFAHSDDVNMSADIDLKQPSSPDLPSSVSRSRGKHFASNRRDQDYSKLSLNKQHPVKVLSGKTSWLNSGYGEEIKPKPRFINSKAPSRSKISFVLAKKLTVNAKRNTSKAVSSHGDSEGSLSSGLDKKGESNTSTITSESDLKPQQRKVKLLSRAFGCSSGLSSGMRVSLGKSCDTRQASRMNVNKNKRLSIGCNSMSGKSSVGSSSNPGPDVKSTEFAWMQHREHTPDSRNVASMTIATKNNVKNSTVSKALKMQVKEGVCNSRKKRSSNVLKPARQEVVKSKQVQNQTTRVKALLPDRVEQCLSTSTANDKIPVRGATKLVAAGNGNATGRVPLRHECSLGSTATGVMARDKKIAKQNALQKGTRLVVPKEKMSSPNRGKHTTNATQRVYLR